MLSRPLLRWARLVALLVCCALPLTASAAAPTDTPDLPSAVLAAASAVTPALVRIHVVEVNYHSGREVKLESTGSGVILTKEGHILTNHHVAGKAKQIICTLVGSEDIDAELEHYFKRKSRVEPAGKQSNRFYFPAAILSVHSNQHH